MFGNKEPQQESGFRIDQLEPQWQPLPEEEDPPVKSKPTHTGWRIFYEAAAVFCTAVLATLLFFVLFRPVTVQGNSMKPTLQNGDYLLLYCFDYIPEQGDVVVIERENAEPLIKRVVAVAGDTVYIDPVTQLVYCNGERLEEPYLTTTTPPLGMTEAVTVPEGHIFVLGDNRYNSHDSRSDDIGMVNVESVIGKALVRLYPEFTVFDEAGE